MNCELCLFPSDNFRSVVVGYRLLKVCKDCTSSFEYLIHRSFGHATESPEFFFKNKRISILAGNPKLFLPEIDRNTDLGIGLNHHWITQGFLPDAIFISGPDNIDHFVLELIRRKNGISKERPLWIFADIGTPDPDYSQEERFRFYAAWLPLLSLANSTEGMNLVPARILWNMVRALLPTPTTPLTGLVALAYAVANTSRPIKLYGFDFYGQIEGSGEVHIGPHYLAPQITLFKALIYNHRNIKCL